MSYKYMRVLVFFDLPTLTSENKREYVRFRKYLVKNGFLMLQESVYSKLALNSVVSKSIMENVRKNKPLEGLIQMLCITEKQYAKMEYVLGKADTVIIDNDERLVVL